MDLSHRSWPIVVTRWYIGSSKTLLLPEFRRHVPALPRLEDTPGEIHLLLTTLPSKGSDQGRFQCCHYEPHESMASPALRGEGDAKVQRSFVSWVCQWCCSLLILDL